MLKVILALATLALTTTAGAFEVKPCDEVGVGLTSIVPPSAESYRAFYKGQVSVYTVDQVEPACCAMGIAIVIPDNTAELGGLSKCFAITHLGGVDTKKATTSYDPTLGLLITIPTGVYTETGHTKPGEPLKVRVNLKTASVTLEN